MKKKGFWLRKKKQVEMASGVCALGLLVYLAAAKLRWDAVAYVTGPLFAVLSIWVFFSAVDLRQRDRAAVSYNLLWGTGALALLLLGCAAVVVRQCLGV